MPGFSLDNSYYSIPGIYLSNHQKKSPENFSHEKKPPPPFRRRLRRLRRRDLPRPILGEMVELMGSNLEVRFWDVHLENVGPCATAKRKTKTQGPP